MEETGQINTNDLKDDSYIMKHTSYNIDFHKTARTKHMHDLKQNNYSINIDNNLPINKELAQCKIE